MFIPILHGKFQVFPGVSRKVFQGISTVIFVFQMATLLEDALQKIKDCPVEEYKETYRRALGVSTDVDLDYENSPKVYSPQRISEEFGIAPQTQLEFSICIDRKLIPRFLKELGLPIPLPTSIDKKISASAYKKVFGEDAVVSKANRNKNVYTYAEVLHLLKHNIPIYLPNEDGDG